MDLAAVIVACLACAARADQDNISSDQSTILDIPASYSFEYEIWEEISIPDAGPSSYSYDEGSWDLTATPTASPVTAAVDITIGMAGITCADYGTSEEAVVNAALASTIDGTDSSSFGPHMCTDVAAERRSLLSSSISIDVTAEVDASAYGGDVTAVAASVATVMAAAVSDNSFAAAIATEAAAADLSTLATLTVTSAVAYGSPTAAPSPAPSLPVAPTNIIGDDGGILSDVEIVGDVDDAEVYVDDAEVSTDILLNGTSGGATPARYLFALLALIVGAAVVV